MIEFRRRRGKGHVVSRAEHLLEHPRRALDVEIRGHDTNGMPLIGLEEPAHHEVGVADRVPRFLLHDERAARKPERCGILRHRPRLRDGGDRFRHQAAAATEDDARRRFPREELCGSLNALHGKSRQRAICIHAAPEHHYRICAV